MDFSLTKVKFTCFYNLQLIDYICVWLTNAFKPTSQQSIKLKRMDLTLCDSRTAQNIAHMLTYCTFIP